jgi:hypothetical protein
MGRACLVRQLASRWPERWPRSPKAPIKAARWVDALAGGNEALRQHLLRTWLDAAWTEPSRASLLSGPRAMQHAAPRPRRR